MVASLQISLLFVIVASFARAQEGGLVGGATSNPQAAGYTCDPTVCVLPSCNCASVNPPGNLKPAQVPQFITFTADDAIEVYTIEAVNHFLAQRKNPNGCPLKMTYFNSLLYNNFSMVTDWYVAGNEIADHTMTHVGTPNASELLGNRQALNAFSGIPYTEIKGFRAPFLNYSADTLTQLHTNGFLYDSSATSASPANATNTDAFWPYTLDYGFANDCIELTDVCQGKLKLPGLWEIPMYATFEEVNSDTPIHLMDPWLDSTDMSAVLNWLKSTFLSHYQGSRQPFGLYTHPIHVAVGYPGVTDPLATRAMINTFLDWVQTFDDVWFVTNQQLLEWIQDPVPIANLSTSTALTCQTPNVDASLKICNGITNNELGLLLNCPFSDFPWTTCYGCPVSQPSPANPVPSQNTAIGVRAHLPTNCSTAFFDPVKNQCLCETSACAFTDITGTISEPPNVTVNATTSSSSSASSTPTGKTTGAGSKSVQAGVVSLVAGLFAVGLLVVAF